jgi:hypothetical protein
MASSPGLGAGSTEFFSQPSGTPIHNLNRKELMEVYRADEVFILKLKHIKWNNSLFKWNKQLDRYLFIDWLPQYAPL